MKKDIGTREDIDLLMKVFYQRLLADNSINYIFTDVARINIEEHLPVIADFWESVLFNRNVYHNNPMKIHLEMAGKTPLLKHHFDTWLFYFDAAVDELFDGGIALKAKQRALSIATVMQVKILQQNDGII
ncbi:MAG: group III truncated hemoglobin [Ginsengibacter sp.]